MATRGDPNNPPNIDAYPHGDWIKRKWDITATNGDLVGYLYGRWPDGMDSLAANSRHMTGIPPEVIKVFEPYWAQQDAREAARTGTGLQ